MKISVRSNYSKVIDKSLTNSNCVVTDNSNDVVLPEGLWVFQGTWDATTNLAPTLGSLGDAIKKGYNWTVVGNSTILTGPDGGPIVNGSLLVAMINNPSGDTSDETQWKVIYGQI